MKLYKGYSPKYSSGYLFYLVLEDTKFMCSQGNGYYKNRENTVIRKVKLYRAERSLVPIGISDEATQSNT